MDVRDGGRSASAAGLDAGLDRFRGERRRTVLGFFRLFDEVEDAPVQRRLEGDFSGHFTAFELARSGTRQGDDTDGDRRRHRLAGEFGL